jgi:tetratricopeptide (TPR) repeat protein
VDTSAQIEQNVLPEHLPARWESESQLLGSKKIYTPKAGKKHYMDYPLELFQKGRYEACLVQINKISKRLPGNLNLSFYRALCHYHLEEYDSAIEQFRATQRIVHPGFYEEAKWYEALSLEKAGQANQAKEIYTEIVDQNGFYAIRAASRLAILLQAE